MSSPEPWPADLVVLVPVYNHAATVGAVVAAARALGAAVLVVDDGSTDGSGEVVAGAIVVRLERNRGKGAALARGLAEAASRGYARALACDADGQHPPEAVALLAGTAAADPAALWLGVRRMGHAPLASRIGRWWTNVGTWLACGLWPRDNQTGLRIYPLPAMDRLAVRAGRYSYEVESTVRAVWAGIAVRTCEVPVLYPVDRVSHFRGWRDSLRAFATFARLVFGRPFSRA